MFRMYLAQAIQQETTSVNENKKKDNQKNQNQRGCNFRVSMLQILSITNNDATKVILSSITLWQLWQL